LSNSGVAPSVNYLEHTDLGGWLISGLAARLTAKSKDLETRYQAYLFAESDTKFFLKVVDAEVEFFKNEKGEVTHLVLHQGGRDMTGTKK